MTANEVKFSEAMSSMPRHWRRFSFSIRSKISGSVESRGVLPQTLTGSMTVVMVVVVRKRDRGRLVVVVRGFWKWGVGIYREMVGDRSVGFGPWRIGGFWLWTLGFFMLVL